MTNMLLTTIQVKTSKIEGFLFISSDTLMENTVSCQFFLAALIVTL